LEFSSFQLTIGSDHFLTVGELVRRIDYQASTLYDTDISQTRVGSLRGAERNPLNWFTNQPIDLETARRLACYMTVKQDAFSNSRRHARLINIPQLVSVYAPRYFPRVSYQLSRGPGSLPDLQVLATDESADITDSDDSSDHDNNYESGSSWDGGDSGDDECSSSSDNESAASKPCMSSPPESDDDDEGRQRQCKIGFFILSTSNTEGLKRLVRLLHRPDTRLLINIDQKFPDNQRAFEEFLDSPAGHNRYPNADLIRRNWSIFWGHSSMVMAELDALFELQASHDCEYFINLSDNSYPLQTPEEMYGQLRSAGPTVNWFGNTFDTWALRSAFDMYRRINGPPIVNSAHVKPTITSAAGAAENNFPYSGYLAAFSSYLIPNGVDRRWLNYPFADEAAPVKADQWMALTSSFVRRLRSDQFAWNLLAFMEWTCISDELYFSTVAAKLLPVERRLSKATTYVSWVFGIFPKTFEERDFEELKEARRRGFFFARKLYASQSLRLADALDDELIDNRQSGRTD
jgi:hypothetical protein